MKITLYKKDGKTQTQRTLELIAALEAMKTEIKGFFVTLGATLPRFI